jgi:hypothetical protein
MTEEQINTAMAHPLAVKIQERVEWALSTGYFIRPLTWGVGWAIPGRYYRCPTISYCCPLATLLINTECKYGYREDVRLKLGEDVPMSFVRGFLFAWDGSVGWTADGDSKLAFGQLGYDIGLAFRARYYDPVPFAYPGMLKAS